MKNHTNETLIISSFDIAKIVEEYGLDYLMDRLITDLILALEKFDPDETMIPIRSGFHYQKPINGLIEWMPIHQRDKHVMMNKLVGYHPANPVNFDLPTILSTVATYDTQTGNLRSLMDGVFLTALRTGAASAIASKYLAHPDCQKIGLLGCGAQAVTQLHGLSRIFDISSVYVNDRDSQAMMTFKERVQLLDLDLEIIPTDLAGVLKESEIICTATSIEVGQGPLFSTIPHCPYVHLNAVGSDFPGKIEIPKELLQMSFVCPDFRDQAIVEGECQQLGLDEIGPSLVEVVRNPDIFKKYHNERTVFDSTGYALEDLVAMQLLTALADELNLGQRIQIEHISMDVKNPYHFLRTKSVEPVSSNTL